MKMIKRFTAGIIAIAMALSLMPAFTLTAGAADDVTISTAEDLKDFAERVNNGETSLNATLTADIDLDGNENNQWTPIGTSSSRFTGTFDGNGKKITGLYINAPDSSSQGLFGYVGEGGTVKNLGVEDGTVLGKGDVGSIAGRNYGTVTNCYNAGTVSGSGSDIGGVVGYNHEGSVLTNCYNTGTVLSKGDVGGIVGGQYKATLTNCYNTGAVNSSDGSIQYLGGIVGSNTGGAVTNCYNTGALTSAGSTICDIGGIVGYNVSSGAITNCYSTGTLTNTGSVSSGIGGIAGSNTSGTLTNCYFLSGTASKGSGNSGSATSRSKEQFKNLASSLGDAWTDSEWFEHPTLVSNPEVIEIPDLPTLEKMRNYINGTGGYAAHTGDGEYFKLTSNIDMSGSYGENINGGTSWTPIGTDNTYSFTGTFDGNGHKITGLYINSNSNFQGLFGYVGKGGTIQNLGVDGSVTVTYLSNAYFGGGVAGYNGGTIANCYNTGIIKGVGGNHIQIGTCVGGVVGLNYGTVTNCYNIGSVSGNAIYVGGVVGDNERSAVTNCYNTGDIKGDGDKQSYVGGVVGYSYSDSNGTSKVQNCYNTGKVTEICSGSTKSAGGVVGRNYSGSSRTSAVTNCYNTGSVSGTGDNVGGVAGSNTNGTVTNCYYLDSCGAAGEYGTNKTEAEFNSGEIAWLLQNGQNTQVWGQALAAELKDESPILTNDNTRKVLKVIFNKADNTAEYGYTNPGGNVEVPAVEKEFVWVVDGSEFTSDTPVTVDMTVTAVKKFDAEIDGDIITANGTGEYKDDVASGFAALITSNLNRAAISKLSVNVGGKAYTPNGVLPELTIDSGSGIVIGVIIPGITITSASAITFNIE